MSCRAVPNKRSSVTCVRQLRNCAHDTETRWGWGQPMPTKIVGCIDLKASSICSLSQTLMFFLCAAPNTDMDAIHKIPRLVDELWGRLGSWAELK